MSGSGLEGGGLLVSTSKINTCFLVMGIGCGKGV